MVNPPSLEKLNQQNEKVEKIDKKILINKEEHHQKCNNKKIKVLNNALTNAILAKKTNEDKNLQHNKEDKKEENKESSDEEPENENEAPKLTKENYENLKKTAKFTRRYKKALKDKKKQEKIYKHILENNEIALKEIKKAEKQKRKKKVSVFNELMNQHRKSIISLDEKNKLSKADNYSSVSSSEIRSELERMKDEIDKEENLNEDDIESNKEENEGKSVLGSVSEITNELEEFNEVKEIVKPKTIKEAFDEEKRKMSYRRRGGVIIPTPEVFKKIIRLKELSDLNDKMKKVYADIYREKKRDEHKKKRKKHYIYSFAGVDLDNIKDVEIRKKVHLERIKEDIKYKISFWIK